VEEMEHQSIKITNLIISEKNMSAPLTDDLLRSFLPAGASKHDQDVFIHICKKTGLDPVLKQIHPVARKTRNANGEYVLTITNQTSIDGYRLIAERTGRYSPGREPSYAYDKDGKIISATSYIKKQTIDGTWHEVGATAFWKEYAQVNKDGRPTQFWEKMGHLMLAKCAEALALRKAFPDMYSKIYTDDEMNNPMTLESSTEEQTTENPVETETITEKDAKELEAMLNKCTDTTFVSNVKKYMKTTLKADNFLQLHPSRYEIIKKKIVNKIQEDTKELAHV
jgi:phage recombination protein Bet